MFFETQWKKLFKEILIPKQCNFYDAIWCSADLFFFGVIMVVCFSPQMTLKRRLKQKIYWVKFFGRKICDVSRKIMLLYWMYVVKNYLEARYKITFLPHKCRYEFKVIPTWFALLVMSVKLAKCRIKEKSDSAYFPFFVVRDVVNRQWALYQHHGHWFKTMSVKRRARQTTSEPCWVNETWFGAPRWPCNETWGTGIENRRRVATEAS